MFPTLPTLLRISLVFGVGLDFFFSDPRQRHALGVVRRKERLRFAKKDKGLVFNFECLDFAAVERKLNAYYADFGAAPPGKIASHQHDGVEFIYVIDGTLGLTVGTTTTRCAPATRSTSTHRWPIPIAGSANRSVRQSL